jgi:hypothetical protein
LKLYKFNAFFRRKAQKITNIKINIGKNIKKPPKLSTVYDLPHEVLKVIK